MKKYMQQKFWLKSPEVVVWRNHTIFNTNKKSHVTFTPRGKDEPLLKEERNVLAMELR